MLKIPVKYKYLIPEALALKMIQEEDSVPPEPAGTEPEKPAETPEPKKQNMFQKIKTMGSNIANKPISQLTTTEYMVLRGAQTGLNKLQTDDKTMDKSRVLASTETGDKL